MFYGFLCDVRPGFERIIEIMVLYIKDLTYFVTKRHLEQYRGEGWCSKGQYHYFDKGFQSDRRIAFRFLFKVTWFHQQKYQSNLNLRI